MIAFRKACLFLLLAASLLCPVGTACASQRTWFSTCKDVIGSSVFSPLLEEYRNEFGSDEDFRSQDTSCAALNDHQFLLTANHVGHLATGVYFFDTHAAAIVNDYQAERILFGYTATIDEFDGIDGRHYVLIHSQDETHGISYDSYASLSLNAGKVLPLAVDLLVSWSSNSGCLGTEAGCMSPDNSIDVDTGSKHRWKLNLGSRASEVELSDISGDPVSSIRFTNHTGKKKRSFRFLLRPGKGFVVDSRSLAKAGFRLQ
jgi:hypothetical protein